MTGPQVRECPGILGEDVRGRETPRPLSLLKSWNRRKRIAGMKLPLSGHWLTPGGSIRDTVPLRLRPEKIQHKRGLLPRRRRLTSGGNTRGMAVAALKSASSSFCFGEKGASFGGETRVYWTATRPMPACHLGFSRGAWPRRQSPLTQERTGHKQASNARGWTLTRRQSSLTRERTTHG